jgi:hypothetical protein
MIAMTETPHARQNDHLCLALFNAQTAVSLLNDQGICVIAVMANGRRPLLMIDRMPNGVVSVVKRRSPNGRGGYTVVRATEWCGCQLESMHDEPTPEAKTQLCGRPLPEVARG